MPRCGRGLVLTVAAAVAVALALVSVFGLGRDERAERRRMRHALLAPYTEPKCGAIPRHVHFIHNLWDDNALSDKELTALQTWMRGNKGWDVHIWDRQKLTTLFTALGKGTAAMWNRVRAVPNHGQRSDLARYLLLSVLGGVYADIDVYAKDKSLDDLIGCDRSIPATFVGVTEAVLTEEEQAYLATEMGHEPVRDRVANYFFASAPGGDCRECRAWEKMKCSRRTACCSQRDPT
ncbi:hypothetical protein PTSG_05326 [Salpingoeca rosetta]|uniref:Uncharacterized protein n=1 Tax=Salpingoeca rosetta (strain ATCC 50818 / BSB-021) TaxID=946362 RepID=F2UA43_SALR5|nr:uncharacterized protein PTSG_05326 [Salpingoeca rosetta]EGD73618.1 hypothetical protein PTSG_05326 [Salpingoeca rosetta]|eukprot:XP_004993899.1 hypothetical protein PTSG_05326 [Salpingoeca rosetta]